VAGFAGACRFLCFKSCLLFNFLFVLSFKKKVK